MMLSANFPRYQKDFRRNAPLQAIWRLLYHPEKYQTRFYLDLDLAPSTRARKDHRAIFPIYIANLVPVYLHASFFDWHDSGFDLPG